MRDRRPGVKESEPDRDEVGFDEAAALAVDLHRRGRLDDARLLYDRLLEACPDHADLLHFRGVLDHQQGRPDEAIARIRRSIALRPEHPDFRNNLGNVYREIDRDSEAEAEYRAALRAREGFADAHNNLGTVLRARGATDEAIARFRRAVELAPDHRGALVNLGRTLCSRREWEAGFEAFRRVLELDPLDAHAYRSLGLAYYCAGRLDLAAELYARWAERDPDSELARHLLAASTGGDVPERASNGAVRAIFDRFAEAFDEKLEHLGYRAPRLVAEALREALGAAAGSLAVLDAGCGTGLCGPFLRPIAATLVGVDLSEAMLAKARDRGGYDRLVAGELVAFLDASPRAFDAIASADTLCYLGRLDGAFAAAARSLRPGGVVAFTVERLGDGAPTDGSDWTLLPHGRYAHSRAYVERTLAAAGLAATAVRDDVLRTEMGRPVRGLVVAARRVSDTGV